MKDPAFLFYSSDFLSGVQDLTMEERGQYITLLCIQHQKGHLTEKMIRLCLGNAAASPAADVMAKFRQDSAGLWYNERLEQEIEKRRAHGEKQRKRALEGWEKRKKNTESMPNKSRGNDSGNAAALPLENVNEIENINENRKDKEVQEEKDDKFSDAWFHEIFDEIMVESIRSTFPKHNLEEEFKIFRLKVRGSPADYQHRDTGGIRQAFIYQLKNSKPHVNGTTNKTSTVSSSAKLERPTEWGTIG